MEHSIDKRLAAVDWSEVSRELHAKGYANIRCLLSDKECDEFIQNYDRDDLYRKTVVMERYRFGAGEYRYFDYPLPALIRVIREQLYSKLAPVANAWMRSLSIQQQFPLTHDEMVARCHKSDQQKPTPLILKYGTGGYNTLHQDLYGDVYFPLQAVLFLNEPASDYTGGEFVMIQQTPRAQSRAIVLQPAKGDMLIFTTNFRPVKGSKGYYRAAMKHGVSEVRSGERHTLGIIFHDALT